MRTVKTRQGEATVDGRSAIHLCSNDYLGLSQNARVVKKMRDSLAEVSQCSSRLVAGNGPSLGILERKLAEHRMTEAALVFPTGYMANLGTVTALADKDSTIFSDALNHASIIDACRLSAARIVVFRHNDPSDLERQMRRVAGRKILVTEGVFSMDGDIARLDEICRVARKFGALTLVDDAHGDFVFGPRGAGIPALFGESVDVHVSSLSKGLGCFGGYVASSSAIIDLLVNSSRQFIYTSALPEHLCVAAAEAMRLAKAGNLQARLFRNVELIKEHLARSRFALGSSESQIIPLIVGGEADAMRFSSQLLEEGVFAQAVRYPTVERGSARLRISISAAHTKGQLSRASQIFDRVGRAQGLIAG